MRRYIFIANPNGNSCVGWLKDEAFRQIMKPISKDELSYMIARSQKAKAIKFYEEEVKGR